ncbi:MAG: hypothetical protein LAT78_10325 [Roseinatronobacter sp.]|nr:hypothetical protein [Roseinatronobacter sp.]
MTYIFALHPLLMLALFIGVGLLSYVVAFSFLAYFGRGQPGNTAAVPVPNFAATITTTWALAMGFTAAEIWSVNAHAKAASAEERSAIARLGGIAAPDLLGNAQMVETITAYQHAVQQYELDPKGERPAAEVDAIIENLRAAIFEMAHNPVPDSIMYKITMDFDQLQDARGARLAIGNAPVSDYKWYLVIFLTLLSQIALAAVHADRRQGGQRALAIFTVAATFSIWLLALHAHPYVGISAISIFSIVSNSF